MQPFVPKSAAGEAAKSAPAKPCGSGSFVPLQHALRHASRKMTAPTDPSSEPLHSSGKIIQVIEQEGVIQKILVTCSCGEVIEIDCLYSES